LHVEFTNCEEKKGEGKNKGGIVFFLVSFAQKDSPKSFYRLVLLSLAVERKGGGTAPKSNSWTKGVRIVCWQTEGARCVDAWMSSLTKG